MFRILLFILFFGFEANSIAQNTAQAKQLDSIQLLWKFSKDVEKSLEEQLTYAKTASRLSIQTKLDTLILSSNKILASLYLDSENYELYKQTTKGNLDLATKLKDSSSIANANQNLAWYHYIESNTDSSYYYYYRARGIYHELGKTQKEGEVLLNMADLQETERDFIGSETNAIEAIKLIQQLPENENNLDNLWILHNLLGIISKKLKIYDKALEYHEKALDYSKEMSDGYVNQLFSLNNIALVYREKGDHEIALQYHRQLLGMNDLFDNSPESYALYLNNFAFTEVLSEDYEETDILNKFWYSKRICDSLNFDFGTMSVRNSLSKFYLLKNVPDSALYYGKRANETAKKTSNNEVLLESLLSLSKLEDGEMGKAYLNDYIRLSDSLLQNERANRNKFARIEFETDQIKAENVQITKERLIFLLSSVGLLVTLILLYIIISQRAKNKELAFSQKQQEANEEIYNLMLAQQDKIDEGRTQEKKRISEELHDGVLGRLFGTRLSLDSLNLQQTEDAVKTRGQYIDELKAIEQEIRKISHDLNTDFISGSSFTDIIKALIENQTKAYQLTYDYYEDDEIDWDALSNKTKIHVYRMLQETMQNIYKHANANHIIISFQFKNSVILLLVEDDGDGFNTGKAKKGIGLKNFDSRANEIGGKVEIFSKIGQGTRVKIHVPT